MYRTAGVTMASSLRRNAARPNRLSVSVGRHRWLSDNFKGKTPTSGSPTVSPQTSGPMEFKNAAEQHAYLKAANAEMEKYHHARELMKQGKLSSKGKSSTANNGFNTGYSQLGIVAVFLAAFLVSPFIGKRIAQDEEFRKRWIPSWYDFTVPKPENPWTREELHEQMVAVQREIRERAIAGDFSPEKLDELQKNLEGQDQYTAHRASIDQSEIRQEWERIHPGLEEGEDVNEN